MINYDLKKIKGIVFDIDGVLSSNRMYLSADGNPTRTANIKDGYALQLAVKKGFEVGIITGGGSGAVQLRYERLGIKHIYMCSRFKIDDYDEFLTIACLKDEEVMYCGDDIPDYDIMSRVGLPVAPADAAPEIKAIAKYISPFNGGDGVARDIIEQIMKVQGSWMGGDEAFGW